MKYVISENRLQRYIFNQLNDLELVNDVDTDGEIFSYYDLEDQHGAFWYEPRDKSLAVDPNILQVFKYVQGVKGMDNYEPVRVWFELKYGVPVDEVIPWDW